MQNFYETKDKGPKLNHKFSGKISSYDKHIVSEDNNFQHFQITPWLQPVHLQLHSNQ